MDRNEWLQLIKSKIKKNNLIKHCLAVEASMKELAKYFGEDEELWGLAGLIHDLDYEETGGDPSMHGLKTAKMIKGKVDERIIYAVKVHAGHSEPKSKMDLALYAVDALTGLIVSACLVHPTKNLTRLDKDFIMHRFKEKHFAQGADREQIKVCEKLGISLKEFVEITLKGMQNIHHDLGL